MQTAKEILTYLDMFFCSVWGITLTDILPTLLSTPTALFSTVDNFIKLLFSLAGFVYLILRIWNYYHTSKLNRELKKLDIEHKKNESFYKKWNNEFLEEKV